MSGWEGLRARQRVVSSMGGRDKVADDNGFECDECVSKGFTKEFFSYRTNKRLKIQVYEVGVAYRLAQLAVLVYVAYTIVPLAKTGRTF